MPLRARPFFSPEDGDIIEPITKFGGQPVWIDGCQWPISASLDIPMSFIGQIRLDDDLFSGHTGKMAYLFMTDGDASTWEANSGEKRGDYPAERTV